jgi:hypothetical protein
MAAFSFTLRLQVPGLNWKSSSLARIFNKVRRRRICRAAAPGAAGQSPSTIAIENERVNAKGENHLPRMLNAESAHRESVMRFLTPERYVGSSLEMMRALAVFGFIVVLPVGGLLNRHRKFGCGHHTPS